MKFQNFSHQWNLKARLMLVGLTALLLSMLPSGLLLNASMLQLSILKRKTLGLPVDLTWQDSLSAL